MSKIFGGDAKIITLGSGDIDDCVMRVLLHNDALWTSDVAKDSRLKTKVALFALKRLERQGKIERIVRGGRGRPSSWRKISDHAPLLASIRKERGCTKPCDAAFGFCECQEEADARREIGR